jgi:hypothetical protein
LTASKCTVSVLQKGDSATRNASVILAAISKNVGYKSTRLNNSLTSDIQVPSKVYPHGYHKDAALAKNQDVGRTIVNATALV